MNTNVVNQITQLLSQAGSAHHVFEQTVLKGVYDQEWPRWYAEYVVEHSLGHLLNKDVTIEQVSRFFSESYDVYKQENSKLCWAEYTAQKMAVQFEVVENKTGQTASNIQIIQSN